MRGISTRSSRQGTDSELTSGSRGGLAGTLRDQKISGTSASRLASLARGGWRSADFSSLPLTNVRHLYLGVCLKGGVGFSLSVTILRGSRATACATRAQFRPGLAQSGQDVAHRVRIDDRYLAHEPAVGGRAGRVPERSSNPSQTSPLNFRRTPSALAGGGGGQPCQALVEEAPFCAVVGEFPRAPIGVSRIIGPSETAQEFGSGGVEVAEVIDA